MKRFLLPLILLPSIAFAQSTGEVIRNDNGASVIQNNDLKASKISTDDKGRIFINPNQTPIPVSMLSSAAIPVYPRPAPTAVVTTVPDQGTSTTCLSANSNRAGAEFVNNSTEIAYLKKGTTASSTSFTVRLMPQDYYYQEDAYSGKYDCIWANNASGGMQVTETEP